MNNFHSLATYHSTIHSFATHSLLTRYSLDTRSLLNTHLTLARHSLNTRSPLTDYSLYTRPTLELLCCLQSFLLLFLFPLLTWLR